MRGRIIVAVMLAIALLSKPASAGTCLSRAEGFELNSDTVHWTFTIRAGSDCLQGLRASTMLIDEVKILDQPIGGNLTISGPAFIYRAPPTASGDRFRIQVIGQNRRIRGTSTIIVEILVR